MHAPERTILRANRSYVLLVASLATRGLAFWLCWLGLLALASFDLGASAGQIALITAATSLPHIFLSPFLGQFVDRSNPKLVLIGTYVWNAATAAALLFVDAVWQTYVVAFAWSLSGAMVWPAIGSLLKTSVPEHDLARANGFLHSVWEATLIVGPLLSGFLGAQVSRRAPFAVALVASLGSAVILTSMRHVPGSRAAKPAPGRRITELREGIALMLRLPELRTLAIWGAGAWAGFSVLIAVEPVFVRDFLGGDGSMLGAMYSVGGIGATIGALCIGWFLANSYELRVASAGLAIAGTFFALYIAIGRWPHVLALQALIGAGFAVYQTTSQSLITRRAPVEVVGRGLAAKRQLEEVAGLIGSLAAGALAGTFGTRETMLAAGVLMSGAAVAMFVRSLRLARPSAGDRTADGAVRPEDLAEADPPGADPARDLSGAHAIGPPRAP